jgi:tetratricopeptide (TPR) repeat protein
MTRDRSRARVASASVALTLACAPRTPATIELPEASEPGDAAVEAEPASEPDPAARSALERAETHRAADEPAEADAAFREALRADPDLLDAWSGLAELYADYGFADEALAVVDACLEQRARDPGALTLAGTIHRDLGDLEAALRSYDEALALDPDSADALFGKGVTALDLGRGDQAIDALERFLEVADDRVPEHVLRIANDLLARTRGGTLPI